MSARAEASSRGFDWSRLSGPRAIAIAGIVLGALAFWLALPPLKSRTAFVPLLIGILAIAAGIWAATRGQRRLGWGAIVAGLVGIAGGVLATRSSAADLDIVVVWSALGAATLRYATPLTFAALGGLFAERSGVVNIGLEGMMLMGAFFGIWANAESGSWVVGILAAMAAGGLLALIHAFFSIHLRADQIVSGTAVNFLALGITGYLYIDLYGDQGTPSVSGIPDVRLSFLDDVYFLGPIFAQLNLMIWISFALLIATYVVMFKTKVGLRIRSVGEHPRAAETVGISVYRTRYAAVTVSGMLAALGGAYLSIGFVHAFGENMTAGKGFIGLAALIFGNWRPFGAFGAALLFGFSSALAQRLPDAYGTSSGTLFETLPYVLTLIAVAGVIGRSRPPAAVGRPYQKQ
ncbi:MAG: ABC transporter permease [Actinobacteria bacterium]|nr:ABC transporter permease [Actinomycetota bacterium]